MIGDPTRNLRVTHLRGDRGVSARGNTLTACGRLGLVWDMTRDPKDVTCATCRKALARKKER